MQYSCIVIDDNEIERDAIVMHLKKINLFDITGVYSDGLQAANHLAKSQVDVVFSDIDMPELSGLALLKSTKNAPVFVFITSYAEYAAESFNLDALDFVVKPANYERLLKAANKVIHYLDLLAKVGNTTPVELPESGEDYFFLKETRGFTRLNYDEVIYIESMGDFSKVYTSLGKHVTLVNLKNLEKQLPKQFIRVHKQFIINIDQITTVTSTEIQLKNQDIVPISFVHKQLLMDKVLQKTVHRHIK